MAEIVKVFHLTLSLCNVTQERSYVKIWLSPFCLWGVDLDEIQYETGFQ